MWHYDKLLSWYSQELERKDMMFRQFLPAEHVKRYRSGIRRQIGNYLIWLMAATYETKMEKSLTDEQLLDLVKNLHKTTEDDAAARDLAHVKAYIAVTPKQLTVKQAHGLNCTKHATAFLDSINLEPVSLLRHPLQWRAYDKAQTNIAQLMSSELITFLAAFKISRFSISAATVIRHINDPS
jgi:hypothetical protein